MNKNYIITHNNMGDIMFQKIKCQVHDCKYCNCETNLCKLKEIEVCNCISGNSPRELTMCNSYKAKK